MRPRRAPLTFAAILLTAAGTAAHFGCRGKPAEAPASRTVNLTYAEVAGPYRLETDIADAEVRAAARETLFQAAELLEDLDFGAPDKTLTVKLYSSEEARLLAEGDRVDESRFAIRPAGAKRQGLWASVAFPREEILTRRDRVPGLILCDSVRIALAHEAAHLWIFATLTGEERIPESMHEGLAEWVGDRVQRQYEMVLRRYAIPAVFSLPEPIQARLTIRRSEPASLVFAHPWISSASRAFQVDSVAALDRARRRGELPSLLDLLLTTPRESGSPQLWTAAAWAYAGELQSRGSNSRDLTSWLRRMARGDDPAESFRQVFDDGDARGWRGSIPSQLAALPRGTIAFGRDTFWVASADSSETLVLSPLTGTSVWMFGREFDGSHDLDWDASVELLGGGAPELWIGIGFDEGRNGVRLVLTPSGTLSLDEVKDGHPQFGTTANLTSGFFAPGRATPLRIEATPDGVTVKSGIRLVKLPFREGVSVNPGRVGIGAKGGAFVVRNLRVDGPSSKKR